MSRLRRLQAGLCIGGAFLIGGAAAATADVFEGFVNPTASWNHDGEKNCAGTRAVISHGNYDKGGTRGTVYSSYGAACGYPNDKVAGNLKVKNQYMFRYNAGWGVCWGSGWLYNSGQTWSISNYKEWQNAQPCGKGTYRTEAHGGVHSEGQWWGDNVGVETANHDIG